MKKLLAIIALIIIVPLTSHAALTPTSWLRDTVAGFLRPNITTDTLRIPSLTDCDTIDTDADGDFTCGTDGGGGGGTDVILDLGDNGSNESSAIEEIATTGDTNSIFTEPSANKLLINLGLDWPKADTADDLTCTDCIGTTEIADSYVLNTGDTMTGDLFVNALLQVGNGNTSGGEIRFYEDGDNGTNYKAFKAPDSIGSDSTCTFANLTAFIPDSCVGNGVDDTGGVTFTLNGGYATSSGSTELTLEKIDLADDGDVEFNGSASNVTMNFAYRDVLGALDTLADDLFFTDGTSVWMEDATWFFKDSGSGFSFSFDASTITSPRTFVAPDESGTWALGTGVTGECAQWTSTNTLSSTGSACGSGGGGAPDTVDYLVGTASGGLSAEIVVGTSPGGELGGTWASPTLDDSVTTTGWVMGTFSGTTLTAGTVNIDLLDGVGAVDMDYGSGDITDHTFTTDGTGTAEIVLPAGSIDGTEILNDTVTLTTDTNGNYVADVAGTANEITSTHTPGEGSTATISLPSVIDIGGKTSFEIPNAAAPTVSVFGQIAGDNNLWAASRGAPIFYDGTASTALVNVLVSDTPANGEVPVWNTGGTITWEAAGGGSGDVTAVGNCATGACFTGTSGSNLVFDNAGGDGEIDYDGTQFKLDKPIALGTAGVRMTGDGDGAITWLGLGDGSDEDITFNLDDVSNTIGLSSSTSLDKFNFGAIKAQFDDLGGVVDANGTNILLFDTVTSADNYLQIVNATGAPSITAAGADTDVSILLTPKGSGNLVLSSGSTGYIQMNTGASSTSWRLGGIYDSSGNVNIGRSSVASAVNYPSLKNAATGNDPEYQVLGSDTDIDLALTPKGAGRVQSGGVNIPTISSTDAFTNKTLTRADNTMDDCSEPIWFGDQFSNLVVGTNKGYWTPSSTFTLTSVYARVITAGTGSGTITIDVNEGGTTVLSTKITIDPTELDTTTAATAAVISDSSIAANALVTADIDAVTGTTPGNGGYIKLCGTY